MAYWDKTGCADSPKLQNYAQQRPIIMSFSSSMTQEHLGNLDSVEWREKWPTNIIWGKHWSCKIILCSFSHKVHSFCCQTELPCSAMHKTHHKNLQWTLREKEQRIIVLHDWCFPQMFLVGHSSLQPTLSPFPWISYACRNWRTWWWISVVRSSVVSFNRTSFTNRTQETNNLNVITNFDKHWLK